MARFRSRKTFRLVAPLRGPQPEPMPAWKREERGLVGELHDRWTTLHRHCADQPSHLRLGRLVMRLNYDKPVGEHFDVFAAVTQGD